MVMKPKLFYNYNEIRIYVESNWIAIQKCDFMDTNLWVNYVICVMYFVMFEDNRNYFETTGYILT